MMFLFATPTKFPFELVVFPRFILNCFLCSKRQEKQKRVAEAKAAREREEQDKKQRQLEERKQMAHALEQARKKREHGTLFFAFSLSILCI